MRSLTLIASFAYDEQLPPFLIWARAPGMGEFLYTVIWDQRLDDRLTYAFFDPDRFAHPKGVDEARANFEHPGALRASLAVARAMRFDAMARRYGKMRQPVLILSGREDRVTRLPAAVRLAAELPDARHVVIERCGHIPIIEQPHKVLQALLPFLAEHQAPNKDRGCACPVKEQEAPATAPASRPAPSEEAP